MKINLANVVFTEKPVLLAESGEFTVTAQRYSSGVAALRVENSRGGFTILPWMGQMIWRCDFDGIEMAMKSMYDEPKDCKDSSWLDFLYIRKPLGSNSTLYMAQ